MKLQTSQLLCNSVSEKICLSFGSGYDPTYAFITFNTKFTQTSPSVYQFRSQCTWAENSFRNCANCRHCNGVVYFNTCYGGETASFNRITSNHLRAQDFITWINKWTLSPNKRPNACSGFYNSEGLTIACTSLPTENISVAVYIISVTLLRSAYLPNEVHATRDKLLQLGHLMRIWGSLTNFINLHEHNGSLSMFSFVVKACYIIILRANNPLKFSYRS